jgi:hypothetical protein
VADKQVRPNSHRLTDEDARHLLADGLLRCCHRMGPSRVALETGCDEKTIRRARDEESTLGLACTFNLLDVDPHALDALAASKGLMLVPLILNDAADIIPAAGAAIHRIGNSRAMHSPGGVVETEAELLASEGENDALLAAVLERRALIAAAKLRRAERAA